MHMERSRSKRNYNNYYQEYENDAVPSRTKPRYGNNNYNRYPRNSNPNANANNNSGRGNKGNAEGSSMTVTTSYRILCQDAKAGGVIGKGGGIIKQIRQHTGAWVNVHELVQGDEERIIEISDTRRRDMEGRMPPYSPAEAALVMIHERILMSEPSGGGMIGNSSYGNSGEDNEEGEYGGGGGSSSSSGRGYGGVSNRVATRMVVSRMHVGCLLGKGGKIIEQMRVETKTQIRILPRDHTLPRCVSMSEEIVQVVGEMNNVKHAIEIIAARLKESQHRDRSHLHGRLHSDERFYPDDDYVPHMNNSGRRSYADGPSFGSRLSASNYRSNNYSSRQSGYAVEADSSSMADSAEPLYSEDLVFRMLCPVDRVHRVVGESDGIVELLQNEIGVDVKILEPVSGSDEQIIIISSEEGPDDELFPAQEALLHIQTCIVDLAPDQDNIVKTRLLVPSADVRCLEGRDGSLADLEKLTGAKVQIITRDKLPACVLGADELVQIEGEIKAAREALVEVTSRLRSYIYKDFFQRDTPGLEAASPVNVPPVRDGQIDSDLSSTTYQSLQLKDTVTGMETVKQGVVEAVKKSDGERREEVPSAVNSRIAIPLVTRSTLEVVIPEQAVPKLLMKSKNKLTQISELSGASVTLVEDRPDVTEKIVQVSGTPEQAERAQSLLQGFILSTLEDGP